MEIHRIVAERCAAALHAVEKFYERECVMVQIKIDYRGKLRCGAEHVESGTEIITDAPKDNMGNGESFSPTDLVATAVGTCMLTTMGIVAQRLGIDITGATSVVTKEMVQQPARRIGRIGVTIRMPKALSAEQRQRLENAAMQCPVHKSLHPDVEIPVTFTWE